jgi:hypothetical protein
MAFSADRGEIRLFAGISLQNPALHALLAMQKVVGSNPLSRFEKACICRPFLCVQSAGGLRSWGLIADWRGRPTVVLRRRPVFAGICGGSNR